MTAPAHKGEPNRIDGRTLRHQHRRPEILRALTEYLLDNGLAELSLRPAASAIGVSHATLLRHFSTKDDLIIDVVDNIVAHIDDDWHAEDNVALPDFLYQQWIRLTTPAEIRQFPLLFELTARYSRDPNHREDLGTALSSALIASLQSSLQRNFAMPEPQAANIAVLTTAQIRGLAIDLFLSRDRNRADRAMRAFADLFA